MLPNFSENLRRLPQSENLVALQLCDAGGAICAVIENRPGSHGSLRIYAYLADKWGEIGPDAAREGLDLYAEHTRDAQSNFGKHPNIDRLFDILDTGKSYVVCRVYSE